MSQPWTTAELFDAAGAFCNGTLSLEAGRRLDETLAADPQARRLYADYMWVHACLFAEGGELAAPVDPALADELPDLPALWHPDRAAASLANQWHDELVQADPASRSSASIAGRRRHPLNHWAVAAALVGVAAFTGWLAVRLTPTNPMVAQAPAADPAAHVVARITGTRNCIWNGASVGIGYGAKLTAGQTIDLEEGLAEITFDDGTTILLEGPARFDVDSADEAKLSSGRLAAIVPDGARAFRIRTHTLDVFNAGAEYGMSAQDQGPAELHVFNGVVKADVLDQQGRRLRRLELAAAQAARINPLATTVLEFPADDAKFVRNIAPSSGPGDGLLAYEGFRYPEGPLEAQNGGFGWAGPWFNLSVDDVAGPGSNQVKPGSLASEGLVPIGNRAVIASHYNRIRRSLGTSVGGVFDAEGLVENKDEVRLVGRDGKTVYLSFLQRVSHANDGFYGVELHRGDGNGNRVLCIGNGADGAGYGATSNVNVYEVQNLPSLGQETTDVNFFVVKIAFGVENRDVVEVFRNPASLRDEQACRPTAVLRGNFAFDRISLANFDGKKTHEVDEIRIGAHFLAVTGRWGNNQGRLLRQVTVSPLPIKLDRVINEHRRDDQSLLGLWPLGVVCP